MRTKRRALLSSGTFNPALQLRYVVEERALEFLSHNCIRRILHVKWRDCVTTIELPYRFHPTCSKKALLVWLCLQASFLGGELIKDLLLHLEANWRRGFLWPPRTFGPARWRKDCLKISNDFTQFLSCSVCLSHECNKLTRWCWFSSLRVNVATSKNAFENTHIITRPSFCVEKATLLLDYLSMKIFWW